jgi:cell division septum initiation protein DivIVA
MTNKGDDAGQATGDPPSQAAHDGDAGKEQSNTPLAADPAIEQLPEIQGGPRPLQPTVPVVHRPEDFTTPMDKVVYGTLGDPITPNYVRDVNNLEQKRQEILKEAKRVEKMGEKLDGDIAKAQDMLKSARNMEDKYATLILKQINEGGDPQLAQNLEFTVPTAEMLARMYIKNLPYMDKNCDEVRATPIENIVATKELLENNQSLAALETAVKLMTKALVQQEKATSSQKLKSDAALCRSSTTSKAQGNDIHGARPDNESHTGSSEARRREARNRADAIPISSDDRPHGKGQQRNPSALHKNYPAYGYHQDKAAPRHKSNMPPPKYKTFEIPQGGIVIRDNDGKRGRSHDAGRRDKLP